nr:site-specific integrase [Gilliamella sp. ESL0250]
MPTLPPAQLPVILKVINDYPATQQTKLLAYFQLLTLVRPGEAATAKWADIDLKKAIWTIPANSMKMRREHIVPLSKQALKILQKMKDITPPNFEYVFINRKYLNDKSKHTSKETVNTMLKRAGFKNKLVAHGFRSIASTILNESLKFHQELIEISLAHVDKNIIRATYNNAQYLEKRFELMGWWGDYVENVSNVSVL